MSLAPIVMFVYNRADHFQKTYEALSECVGAAESELYIFSDGPRAEKDVPKVEEVREAARTAVKDGKFLKVSLIESKNNRGLAASVISGVTDMVEKYEKVIVIEDDCVTNPFFLRFMNQGLETYEQEKQVGAIAGYTPTLAFPNNFQDDVFFSYRSCSCGWATWKDRWSNVDWELKQVSDFYKNLELLRKLNSNGKDRFIRLYRQTKGNGSSWSVRFGAHLVRNNWLTVYPRYSYIQNIGCDASGVHSKEEDAEKMSVDLSKAIENPVFRKPYVNKEIQKIMKRHYSGGVVSDIKRSAATVGIVLKERLKAK